MLYVYLCAKGVYYMQQMTRVQAIKTYLEKDAKPIQSTEFMGFWKACSDDERKQFATVASEKLGVELKD